LCTVFIFVSCEGKGCYRIVLLGHQNFDCRSYCGLSRRMQGSRSNHKSNVSDTLMSRPMPSPTDFKTLVDVEMGFLYLKLKLRLKSSTQNGNMKKNVFSAALFLYKLALITHDATKSVNPSMRRFEMLIPTKYTVLLADLCTRRRTSSLESCRYSDSFSLSLATGSSGAIVLPCAVTSNE